MLFRLEIHSVQHVGHLSMEINLEKKKLTCIVGKNGAGKTTLVRAIKNLSQSDSFVRTAAHGIFTPESSITYSLDKQVVRFEYDEHIRSLNCKKAIPPIFRSLCAVELPMPHGERFSYFHTVSDADTDIRRKIVLDEYEKPSELTDFLSGIYSSDRFQRLVETRVRGRSYYCILLDHDRYIREDYLSSGEYLLINLYRTIRSGAQLIAVDEIDMSLDATAQVRLLGALRSFCKKYGCNIVFTTHSLAMMQTLDSSELLYMERRDSNVELYPASYNYIKTLLFGFTGWDRYILTEDAELQGLLETIIRRYGGDVFFKYKIIYVGGGSQVTDLLRRNRAEAFLSESANVIAVLDGDQSKYRHAKQDGVHSLPIESVEKALVDYYRESDFPHRLPAGIEFRDGKDLFRLLQRHRVMSESEIYTYICERNEQSLAPLINTLRAFLGRPG